MQWYQRHKRKIFEILFFIGFSILNFKVASHFEYFQKRFFKISFIGYTLGYVFAFIWGMFFAFIHRSGQTKAKRPHPFYLVLSFVCILFLFGFFLFYSWLPWILKAFFTKADYFLMVYAGANFIAAFYEPKQVSK